MKTMFGFENELPNVAEARIGTGDKVWTKAGCSGIALGIELKPLCPTSHSIQRNSENSEKYKQK